MHIIKPTLTKNTVYRKSFYQQKAEPSLVLVAKEYDKLKGPHLDMSSTYHDKFTGRSGDDLERHHPKDQLVSEGPAP
jgi:hypothetical protein